MGTVLHPFPLYQCPTPPVLFARVTAPPDSHLSGNGDPENSGLTMLLETLVPFPLPLPQLNLPPHTLLQGHMFHSVANIPHIPCPRGQRSRCKLFLFTLLSLFPFLTLPLSIPPCHNLHYSPLPHTGPIPPRILPSLFSYPVSTDSYPLPVGDVTVSATEPYWDYHLVRRSAEAGPHGPLPPSGYGDGLRKRW